MRKILLLMALFSASFLNAQENFNLELMSNVPFGEDGNDIWGYEDPNGIEYAVVGSQTNTRIYSLEDPKNPIERILIPGASSVWRDMKAWGEHLYVTTDQGQDGLLIVDMTAAPEDITFSFWTPFIDFNGIQGQLNTCHNIYLDDTGIVHLTGCNVGNGGVMMLDISNPKEPVVIGIEDEAYAHDAYARGDRLYTCDIYDGVFTVFDIEDKADPKNLGEHFTTMNFTHNAWLSDDGNYLFTTDERANGYVDSYDVSDPQNIKYLDSYRPPETQADGPIPHNTHYYNGYLVTSWYTEGLIILDASKPDNLVRVAQYDTYLGPSGGFSGCWGVTPFLNSELIIASDINSGLYVFKPTYQRAAYLEGTVTDMSTGSNINNVTVTLASDESPVKTTDVTGSYAMGQAEAGTYMVTASHPLYNSLTVEATLVNGEVTIADFELEPLTMVAITGSAIHTADGAGVPNAKVLAIGENLEFTTIADANGDFSFNALEGIYTIYGGAWGYTQTTKVYDTNSGENILLEVDKAYEDDFILDLGWTVTGDAATGAWTREEPNGTFFQGVELNPDMDMQNDLGDLCYTTGNGGGGAGDDDVDDGVTYITSDIMDLSTYVNPTVEFAYWFINGGGQGTPNDELTVSVTNGTETVEIASFNESNSAWIQSEVYTIADYVTPTATTQIIVSCSDDDPGHLSEGGFDLFRVYDSPGSAVEQTFEENILVNPNPMKDILNISIENSFIVSLELLDINGKRVLSKVVNNTSTQVNTSDLATGIYTVVLTNDKGESRTTKVIKI